MQKPRIIIYKDFLPKENWNTVNNYCVAKEDNFEFVGYGSPVRWKKYTHTKDENFTYQRSFLMTEEEYDLFTQGKIEEPYPDDSRHGDNYKMSMDIPVSGETFEILADVLDKTIVLIKNIYGVDTVRESGPWITKASKGDYMKMHCDGTFLADRNAYTHYSSVYYINDDFKGGKFSMPKIGFDYKPTANSLVLWAHAWEEDMAHEVLPVIAGNRFVSQGFFTPMV